MARIATEWLVVFEHADHPLTRVLEPGFAHCWAARPIENCWIVVNPAFSHTQVECLDDDSLRALIHEGCSHIWAEAGECEWRLPGLFSCVETVKSLLGISRPFITPYQLYRYIDGQRS